MEASSSIKPESPSKNDKAISVNDGKIEFEEVDPSEALTSSKVKYMDIEEEVKENSAVDDGKENEANIVLTELKIGGISEAPTQDSNIKIFGDNKAGFIVEECSIHNKQENETSTELMEFQITDTNETPTQDNFMDVEGAKKETSSVDIGKENEANMALTELKVDGVSEALTQDSNIKISGDDKAEFIGEECSMDDKMKNESSTELIEYQVNDINETPTQEENKEINCVNEGKENESNIGLKELKVDGLSEAPTQDSNIKTSSDNKGCMEATELIEFQVNSISEAPTNENFMDVEEEKKETSSVDDEKENQANMVLAKLMVDDVSEDPTQHSKKTSGDNTDSMEAGFIAEKCSMDDGKKNEAIVELIEFRLNIINETPMQDNFIDIEEDHAKENEGNLDPIEFDADCTSEAAALDDHANIYNDNKGPIDNEHENIESTCQANIKLTEFPAPTQNSPNYSDNKDLEDIEDGLKGGSSVDNVKNNEANTVLTELNVDGIIENKDSINDKKENEASTEFSEFQVNRNNEAPTQDDFMDVDKVNGKGNEENIDLTELDEDSISEAPIHNDNKDSVEVGSMENEQNNESTSEANIDLTEFPVLTQNSLNKESVDIEEELKGNSSIDNVRKNKANIVLTQLKVGYVSDNKNSIEDKKENEASTELLEFQVNSVNETPTQDDFMDVDKAYGKGNEENIDITELDANSISEAPIYNVNKDSVEVRFRDNKEENNENTSEAEFPVPTQNSSNYSVHKESVDIAKQLKRDSSVDKAKENEANIGIEKEEETACQKNMDVDGTNGKENERNIGLTEFDANSISEAPIYHDNKDSVEVSSIDNEEENKESTSEANIGVTELPAPKQNSPNYNENKDLVLDIKEELKRDCSIDNADKIEANTVLTDDKDCMEAGLIDDEKENEASTELLEFQVNSINETPTQDEFMDIDEANGKENEGNIDLTEFNANIPSEAPIHNNKDLMDNEEENNESTSEANMDLTEFLAPTQHSFNYSANKDSVDIEEEPKRNSSIDNAKENEANIDNEKEKETPCDPKVPQELISINIDEDDEETNDQPKATRGASFVDTKETVRVVCYDYKKKSASVEPDDQNAIFIYCKNFDDTRVASYKGHEYVSMRDQFEDGTSWKCNKSKYCPAVLFIGKKGNEQVHLVSEHDCTDVIDTLKGTQFKKFALVNVIYYEGNSIPGLNMSGDYLSTLKGIIVLCPDTKFGARLAFYDGHSYIKSFAARELFEYGCASMGCQASLRVSRAGVQNKMVLKKGVHTCQQNANKNPSPIEQVPIGLKAVTPINYRWHQELNFFLKINQLCPHTGPPLIYVKEAEEKSVYYQDFEYRMSAFSGQWVCKSKECYAQLYVTSDFRAVSEAFIKHVCDEEVGVTRSRLCNLIKVSKLTDRQRPVFKKINKISEDQALSVMPSKSGYVRVKYKYLVSQYVLESDLDPNDAGTVTGYFDRSTKRDLYYYKGYTYTYGASLQLLLCDKSSSCAGALILRQESSEVMEMEHTCNHVDSADKDADCLIEKSERPCPPLRPIASKRGSRAIAKTRPSTKTNAKTPPTKDSIDKLKYTIVKIKNHLMNEVRVADLDPKDPTTAYVYRNEAGHPIIYYKGYTYYYFSNSRVIYLCSKSRKCSAVLRPHAIRRYELAEIGKHNCIPKLRSKSADGHFEPEPITFRVYPADDFSQIPFFDRNDQTSVTMLVGDVKRHNVVYYRGNMYVDDRSLSCNRGKSLTMKSCNLLYMCVKSHVCSAGLSINRVRTSVLEVGLHNCTIKHSATDHNKLFRELKPVQFCHSEDGGPRGIIDAQTVETYFENDKMVVSYKGHTYMDRITACTHSVGCKRLHICRKRAVCTAALLVDAHDAVLEVGLHSCTPEKELIYVDDTSSQSCNDDETSTGAQKVVYFMPSTKTTSTTSDGSQSSDTAAISDLPSLPDTNPAIKRKRDVSANFPKLKRRNMDISFMPVITINHLENMLKEVLFEEQTQFIELDDKSLEFKGYTHAKKGTEGEYTIYNCINAQFNRCSGRLLVRSRRVIWANNHSCREIPGPGLLAQSNYLIIYYNENRLCPEALYKGFTYLRKKIGKKAVQWTCSKNILCGGQVHIFNNLLAEVGNHTCGNDLLTSNENSSNPPSELTSEDNRDDLIDAELGAKPKQKTIRAERLFMDVTKRSQWDASLIPVLDEKNTLCVIYQGYIYSFIFHSKQVIEDASSSSVSEWMCTHTNCRAVLRLDGAEVRFTSRHYCVQDVSTALSPHHAVQVISPDKQLPLQVFRGKRKCLAYDGYIYLTNKGGYSLRCIYVYTYNCRGTLSLKNSRPIAVSDHSCRNLSSTTDCPTGTDQPLKIEAMDCTDDISVKEEVEEDYEETCAPIVEDVTVKEEDIVEETDAVDETEWYSPFERVKAEGDDVEDTCVDEADQIASNNCDDIIYKEQEQTSAENHTGILVLDIDCLLPDLVPFKETSGPGANHNNGQKLHHIPVMYDIDDTADITSVHSEDCQILEEDSLQNPIEEDAACDLLKIKSEFSNIVDEESIEEIEPIVICDDESTEQPEEDPLNVPDIKPKIEFVECPEFPERDCPTDKTEDKTILKELLLNPPKNGMYSGGEPDLKKRRLLTQNSLVRIQANKTSHHPTGQSQRNSGTSKKNSRSQIRNSNSYDEFEDIEDFIPATVLMVTTKSKI